MVQLFITAALWLKNRKMFPSIAQTTFGKNKQSHLLSVKDLDSYSITKILRYLSLIQMLLKNDQRNPSKSTKKQPKTAKFKHKQPKSNIFHRTPQSIFI